MDILSCSALSDGASRSMVSCDFCVQQFGTMAEKNSHILDHFERHICQRCDQTLLRIGGNFYVLHATLTCIDNFELEKKTSILDKLNLVNASPQPDDSQMNRESDNDGNSLASAHLIFDASSLKIPKTDTEESIEDIHQSTDADEANIEIKIDAENTNAAPSRQTRKLRSSRTKKPTSKHSGCKRSTQIYDCTNCGHTNIPHRSFIRNHQIPNYKCRECGALFCQLMKLKDHYQIHPGADPYDGISVINNQSIREATAQRKIEKFQCPVDGCTKMFSMVSRHRHLMNEHNYYRFECDICAQVFNSLPAIRKHMTVHGATNKLYSCDKCGETKITKEARQRYHDNPNEVCVWCDRHFCLRKQLSRHHIKDRCGPCRPLHPSILRKSLKRFKCPVEGCDVMVSTANRRHHMAMKHTPKSDQFQCDICKKYYATKQMVRVHILQLHDPTSKKYKCDLCGKAFLTQSMMHWHQKNTHTKERTFQCSECGKTFAQKGQLKLHILTHTGEKPMKCTFDGCPKRFRTKTALIEHNRSHTGEKPFECPVAACDRKFAYATDLRRHKFSAHGIFTKKIPCNLCGEIFPENMLLKKHMKKHNLQE